MVATVLAAALFGCSGKEGPTGPQGPSGDLALVNVAAEPAGTHCANAGTRIDSGIDEDGDGVLAAAEVTTTTYVCNGGTGATGAAALVTLSSEAAGSNCADGGTRIDSGLDADANGTLDVAEITSTRYVCNGAAGATGATGLQSLVATTPEAAGANCANGGTRVESGIDADSDGTLDAAEVSSTRYVCNGVDGLMALVAIASEPPGANCGLGGTRLEWGIDTDSSGVLDPAEVTSTSYMCIQAITFPSVVSVTPAIGAPDVANDTSFVLTFSMAMDPATIDGTSVFLLDVASLEQVPATVVYDSGSLTATLTPASQLTAGSTYELTVTSSARSAAGTPLFPEFHAEYTPLLDVVGPALVSVSPADGAEANADTTVTATFDEALVASSVAGAHLSLADGGGGAVPGVVSYAGTTFTFTPSASLSVGSYTATLEVVAADASGNFTVVDTAWSFTVVQPLMTGSPTISPAAVTSGGQLAIHVPVNAAGRMIDVYITTDGWASWWSLGTVIGNAAGEGFIEGTFTVPAIPPGTYSFFIYVHDQAFSVTAYGWRTASVATGNFAATQDGGSTWYDSGIPLTFVDVIADPRPDLTVQIDSITMGSTTADIAYTVTNAGSTAAGAFSVGLYVDPASLPELFWVPEVWLDFTGLAAASSTSGVATVPAPSTSVAAYADMTAQVDETNEANNVDSAPIVTSFTNSTPVAIPDVSTITSTVTASTAVTPLNGASVTLNITHTFDADLRIYLTSPAGTQLALALNRGGSGDNFTGTVFIDSAATPIASGAAPFTGQYQPEQPLSTFAGQNANGTWTLTVQDTAGIDTGTLSSWTLTLW
jgi:subtilisin-like proprotein convertase family protein